MINTKGDIIINPIFDNIGYSMGNNYNYGLIPVSINNKWGFIDEKAKIVIPLIFDFVESFSTNGLALVKEKNAYGFINIKNKIVIPIIFEEAESFRDKNFTAVIIKDKLKYIDSNGKEYLSEVTKVITDEYNKKKFITFDNK